jgi:hypothetical protein
MMANSKKQIRRTTSYSYRLLLIATLCYTIKTKKRGWVVAIADGDLLLNDRVAER